MSAGRSGESQIPLVLGLSRCTHTSIRFLGTVYIPVDSFYKPNRSHTTENEPFPIDRSVDDKTDEVDDVEEVAEVEEFKPAGPAYTGQRAEYDDCETEYEDDSRDVGGTGTQSEDSWSDYNV